MLKRLFDQGSTKLEVDVPADEPDRWLSIADAVAPTVLTKPFLISPGQGEAPNGGRRFNISRRGRRVSGFEVWVTRVWEEADKGPTGRRTVHIDWDEATIDGVGAGANDDDGGILALAKLAWIGRRGVPGYDAFLEFLRAFERAAAAGAPGQVTARLQTTDKP